MKNIPFRIKYFLSHLLISLLVAGVSLFLIFKIWYPSPLHTALGIGGLVVMMLAIDVILGPLLTLVLAKEGKKGLKTDLIVIGIVQLTALFYGLYSIDKGRPVAIAFDINRFELVQKHMIIGDDKKALLKQYIENQDRAIPVVAVRPAENENELAKRMENELELGIMASADPELYEALDKNFEIIARSSKSIADLPKFNDKALAEQIMAQYPQADSFAPLFSPADTKTVLIDSKNKAFVAVVDARPW